jgi:hypothetical protein
MEQAFLLPPRTLNDRGEKRTVGFELEFGGIDLFEASAIILQLFGGRIEKENNYRFLAHTSIGMFSLEADADFLQKNQSGKILSNIGLDPNHSRIAHNFAGTLNSIAEKISPFEIGTPPLPIDRLETVERIREQLYLHCATGTKSSLIAAFGMQINPESPDMRVETILSFVRAFFLLFDWLYEESEIPLSRKIAPFIHDFPTEYVDLVLAVDYRPSLNQFMHDYLEYSPTRNRPLDLLPLFAFLDRETVFSYPVEQDMVKARPTFHYRLPNSQMDDPDWTIASDWNKWVEIEKLAEDPHRIRRMSQDYFQTREESFVFSRAKWIEKTRSWIHA